MLTFLHPARRRHPRPPTPPTPSTPARSAPVRTDDATAASTVVVFGGAPRFAEHLATELAPGWRVVEGPAEVDVDPAIVLVGGFDPAVIDRLEARYRRAAIAVLLPGAHRAADIVALYDLDVDHVITSASPAIIASHLRALARRVAWSERSDGSAAATDGQRLAG